LKALRRLAIVLIVVVSATAVARSYWLEGPSWPGSTVTMQLQLGSSPGALLDGSDGWNTVAENALARWNQVISRLQFQVVRGSTAPIASGNGVNNVIFDSSYFGRSFGAETLAVTLWSYRGSSFTEADVVFNTNWNWNSYRGPLRSSSSGGALIDFRRVALHEFGHVLGLDHPDDHGQNVTAQMNSTISNLDDLADDDINGARALYGAPAATNHPPTVTASCSPCTVRNFQTITLTAVASDPDNDALTLQWSGAGTFTSPTSSTTTWTAPAQTGTMQLTVTVSDGRGGQATATATVQVLPGERLLANDRLLPGQYLTSTNNKYRLQFQGDGNLVLMNLTTSRPIWDSKTVAPKPGQVGMQSDGNLVIINDAGTPLWSSGTPGNANAFLALQGDGNVVIYSAKGTAIWSTGTVGF